MDWISVPLSTVSSCLSVVSSGLTTVTMSLSTLAEVYGSRKRSPSFERLTVSGKVDHHLTTRQENELKRYS
ncbi:hypothetical protein OYT88_14920 [Sporolactobacillus sp. CQH2019]|uniref:hypothetical protein n=1 Tax=Sporolactobacillus sp. CQH2019 TaxID=3023512 RepID=UPI002368280D|nr:hypothetical protein [Sporolactobacillus sp. CQH2019]MDD9149844.1 hypothetical protein [Sporolactobacillus sp. CQH2019]